MRKLKFKLPFLKKKISIVPTDENLTEAKNLIAEYPLLVSSSHLHVLVSNNFIAGNGTQVHPDRFLSELIFYIEKTEPKTKEEVNAYIHQKIAAIPAPLPPKKSAFRKKK